ncbi:diacylglycerol kinase [Streptomyces sp. HMX87]|uniref:diacylglycerol kinase n=1 Tax=Streptomyces sp. HMX87 TaxID=3390849 RepID=UPI003A8674E2
MAEVATSARSSATSDQLLVVIDPVARRADGESVRIAKDVLSAGAASTKVCLPDGPEEFARALRRRGSRRPVVIGDDRALLRAVSLLHRHRELAGCALSVVPVGPVLGLARSLGLPTGAVAAARSVLDGAERRLDLLVDDSDGVVLGAVGIPPVGVRGGGFGSGRDEPLGEGRGGGLGSGPGSGLGDGRGSGFGSGRGSGFGGGRGGGSGDPRDGGFWDGPDDGFRNGSGWNRPGWNGADAGATVHPWLRTCRSLVRTLAAARPVRAASASGGGPSRLRVEVDGVTLVDLDQPVEGVSLTPGAGGVAEVEVRPSSVDAEAPPLTATGRTVTVSGAHFRYRADTVESGPVRTRTWVVREGAWSLTLPAG